MPTRPAPLGAEGYLGMNLYTILKRSGFGIRAIGPLVGGPKGLWQQGGGGISRMYKDGSHSITKLKARGRRQSARTNHTTSPAQLV